MGLLDIWNDWKKENQSQSDGFEDYLPTQGGTLDTAGGVKGSGINATMNRTSESPLIKNPIFPTDPNKGFGKVLAVPPGGGQVTIGGKILPSPKNSLKHLSTGRNHGTIYLRIKLVSSGGPLRLRGNQTGA